MANKATIDAINTALKNEEKSVQLYESAAKATKNAVVKKTMKFLAGWERKHAELIRNLNAHIIGEMKIHNLSTTCEKDALGTINEFFGKNIDDFKKKIKGTKDDIKVYETGMEIEKEGFKFYKKAAQETDNEEAKQLFEFLAKEENMHYVFLQDQHAYLSKPDSWFLDEEKWILEG
jgi:rubrerythrin